MTVNPYFHTRKVRSGHVCICALTRNSHIYVVRCGRVCERQRRLPRGTQMYEHGGRQNMWRLLRWMGQRWRDGLQRLVSCVGRCHSSSARDLTRKLCFISKHIQRCVLLIRRRRVCQRQRRLPQGPQMYERAGNHEMWRLPIWMGQRWS